MNTRLLVDGTGVACRVWYGAPNDCVERFTAAVEKVKPAPDSEVIVCWDGPHSWRRDLYPAYKANRGPKPEALKKALAECRSIFTSYVADGFEADDLLYTFSRPDTAYPLAMTIVLSDDKDLLQLVDNRCLVVNSKGEVFDAKAVEDKWGVPPNRIRHLLSWTGDKVDGLPGVAGIGPKRAVPKALAGEIGYSLTYDLAELAMVPPHMMVRV